MTTERDAVSGVTHLSVHACWALLRDSEVGRLAVVVDGRPDIFPVNFVVDHGSVVMRTGPGTKLAAAAPETSVAFEADGYDPVAGEAWSVVLKGQVELVRTMEEMEDLVGLPLSPWHAAPKPCYVRIVPGEVTGRRFVVVALRSGTRSTKSDVPESRSARASTASLPAMASDETASDMARPLG